MDQQPNSYDLVVVGSGAAAMSAAIHARQLDANVVLVERGTLGGTCVNIGCVPSKTLLAAAGIRHSALAKRSAFASDIIAFAAPSAGGLDADNELELRFIVTHGEGEVVMVAWPVPYCVYIATHILIGFMREFVALKNRIPELPAGTLF